MSLKTSVQSIYILIWVTRLFVKEKLRGACTDLPENFCTALFRTRDHSKVFFWFFFETLILFTQFYWKRTCDTNMRDNNNFFAPKHLRAARKPGSKLWPAVNDWRTHFALFILQIIISFNIHNFSENTNNFVTSNKLYSTTECNIQIILWQHYFRPSHLCVSVLLTMQYFNYVLFGSIICVAQSPPGTNSLAKGRRRRLFHEYY